LFNGLDEAKVQSDSQIFFDEGKLSSRRDADGAKKLNRARTIFQEDDPDAAI
jgi:hypothetical protein